MTEYMRKIVLYLIICLAFSYAQQWVNISPFPDSNIGLSGNFISANEGWIFQTSSLSNQSIYRTLDGGKNWEKIYSFEDSLEILTSLVMTDSLNGWATKLWKDKNNDKEQRKYYMRTSDSGFTWEDMTDYVPDVFEAYSFYFINKNVGFFCGGTDSLTYNALIYKTIDGGYYWNKTETPAVYDPYPYLCSYTVNKFFFADENHGWAACSILFDSGLLLSTDDGGVTWHLSVHTGSSDFFDVHFVDPYHGGAVGRNAFFTHIKITEDNFDSFMYQYDVTSWNQYAQTIYFQNDSTIWITGDPGYMNRSTDGGATFEVYQTIDANLYKIQFYDNLGYVFGYDNNALYKYDGGSGIEEEFQVNGCVLYQNYPNPFNPATEISFDLEKKGHVNLTIYNSKGELVRTLFVGLKGKGMHSINFDASGLDSGIYFYRLATEDHTITRKMLFLK